MQGLMMETPLLISSLIRYAAEHHGDTEVVSRTIGGAIHRYTYRDTHDRARRLASALTALGVGLGDRCATLAWNGYRHLEIYFAVSGMGAVCHTVNPRLFPAQIAYVIDHAADAYVFVDPTFLPLLEDLAGKLTSPQAYIVMTDAADMPATSLPNAICYEALLDAHEDPGVWPSLDENTASSLCYTSGTTGNPRGVLYSHRSTLLHTFSICLPDRFGLSALDTVMPVVPMFHGHAWGMPYGAAMVGSKLVLCGPHTSAAALHELIECERVTVSAGVPTVWIEVLDHLQAGGRRVDTLDRVIIGGSATPRLDDRDVPASLRYAGHTRLGHDRNLAVRHRQRTKAYDAGSEPRAVNRIAGQAGAGAVRSRYRDLRRSGSTVAA